MANYQIITDSGSDLSSHQLTELGVVYGILILW